MIRLFLWYTLTFLKRRSTKLEQSFFVNQDARAISVCWLEGYKNRTAMVDYEDMVAKYDKDGEYMKFGNISEPSVLLEPDKRCIDIER